MTVRGLRAGVAAIALAAAVACISIPLPVSLPQTPATGRAEVKRNAEVFGDNFQWGRVQEAARLVHPDDRDAFVAHAGALEGRLRVTGFEVSAVEVDGAEAFATVVFSVYRPPSVFETTLVDRQRWERRNGAWYLRPALSRY
jgi:hypothetical protein